MFSHAMAEREVTFIVFLERCFWGIPSDGSLVDPLTRGKHPGHCPRLEAAHTAFTAAGG